VITAEVAVIDVAVTLLITGATVSVVNVKLPDVPV
jgi:hypothetical protein